MKSLYSELGFRMNSDATELDREAISALLPIFKKYFDMGYSPREIAHVIHGVATDLELGTILDFEQPIQIDNKE